MGRELLLKLFTVCVGMVGFVVYMVGFAVGNVVIIVVGSGIMAAILVLSFINYKRWA